MSEYVISFAAPDEGETPHDLGYSILGHADVVPDLKSAEQFISYPPQDIQNIMREGIILIAQEGVEYGRVGAFGVIKRGKYITFFRNAVKINGKKTTRIGDDSFSEYRNISALQKYTDIENAYDAYQGVLCLVDHRTIKSAFLGIMKNYASHKFHKILNTASEYLSGKVSKTELENESLYVEDEFLKPGTNEFTEMVYVGRMITFLTQGDNQSYGAYETLTDKAKRDPNLPSVIRRYIHMPDVMLPLMLDDIKYG